MRSTRCSHRVPGCAIVVFLALTAASGQPSGYVIGPNGPMAPPTPQSPPPPPQPPSNAPAAAEKSAGSAWMAATQARDAASVGRGSSGAPSNAGGAGIICYTLHAGKVGAAKPRPAPDAAAAPVSNGAPGVSGEYIIKRFDTLWDLARSLLGDPFGWRQLWSQNQYIQNPDLIYPGEKLVVQGYRASGIPPAAAASSAIAAESQPRSFGEATAGIPDAAPPSRPAGAPSDTAASLGSFGDMAGITAMVAQNMLTAEFLSQVPFLWTRKDEQGLLYPGDSRIDPHSDRQSFQEFDEAPVKMIGSGRYAVGDTVDVFRSIRMVDFDRQPANIVQRIARAKVTGVTGRSFEVLLFRVWDVVKAGDRVGHTQPAESLVVSNYVDPPAPINATVFQRVEDSPLPYPYQSFIIDRGSAEGIQRGDLFYTYPANAAADTANKPEILACAAFTGDHFATLAIVKQSGTVLQPGNQVRLVKRVQYN